MGSVVSVRTKERDYGPIRIRLAGEHQAQNLATSILAAEKLAGADISLSADSIRRGAESARWPARLQTVRLKPRVILDATHNPGGAETLARFLGSNFGGTKPVMVLAMLADKEVGPVVESLEPMARKAIVSQSSYHRRMKAEELASRFRGRPVIESDLAAAIGRAMHEAGSAGTVLVTGSIFTASEALTFLDAVRVEETVTLLAKAYGAGAYPGRDPADVTGPGPRLQDPFTVLISTILSQRTRDENTHAASGKLLSRYGTPEKLAAAKQADVERLIRSTGFYRQKARNIIEVSRILRDRHSSAVPADLAELLSLPGVGRKTANCVLSYGFGIPAIAVDTHVHRICNLMGLVNSRSPEDTEAQLTLKVERGMWNDINRLLVRHGQTVCHPAKPKCDACPISHLCDMGIYLGWQSN